MSVKRISTLRPQFGNADLNPLSGGLLFSYLAGSSARATTYNSNTGLSANANPMVMDSAGRPATEIWVTSGVAYKFALATAGDGDAIHDPSNPIWTEDNVTGINDTGAVTIDEWEPGPTPTYVSATSFTLAGDQRTVFHVGRQVKTTNSGGTAYSEITASTFGALTTITVINYSGVLDSGLSAVSYGLLSSANASIPGVSLSGANWAFHGSASVASLMDLSGAAAGQIKFPATQNASSNANTLDDYEEGTWVPSLGGSATYSVQTGTYTKIGRLVYITGSLTVTVLGTGSVSIVTGLPFAAAQNAQISMVSAFTAVSPITLFGNITTGTSQFQTFGKGAAAAGDSAFNIFGNSAAVSFSGCYIT